MLLWLVDNGQGEEALRRLPAVEAAHPEPARLLLRLGQALDENREAAAAAQLLERSLALDPSRAETRLALGQALFDAGRPGTRSPTCGPRSTRASARHRRLRARPGARRPDRRRRRGPARAALAPPRTDAASLLLSATRRCSYAAPTSRCASSTRGSRRTRGWRRCARSAGWPW